MVGSGGGERSKEAVGMMALHEALRSVCFTTDWTYSVFWTIRPRPRVRGGNGCKVGDDNGSLMLMWEDGFCRGRSVEFVGEMDGGDDPIRKSFSKMSIQLYNYGEGLMGKVASDKCHKWVFKEPTECEPNISNYWQSSYDALPQEWNEQFDSGIQTIAVIQAGHGLLQLGSCKIIAEDLHFVLRMRHTFESLGYQSGFYLTQLFSSTRPASSSATVPLKQPTPPPHLFNWAPRPIPPTGPPMLFHTPAHMFLLPHSTEAHMMEAHMMADHENDIKWPNGLSFFGALTGRPDEPRLMFDPHPPPVLHKNNCSHSNNNDDGGGNTKEFLQSDYSHLRNVEGKFKRSFTLPARMSTLSPSNEAGPHAPDPVDYRTEGGMYPDAMETFLE